MPSLLTPILHTGRPLLSLVSFSLFLSGAFALFLSWRGEFLPHDIAFLGMTPEDLCAINECRIVHFMFHDRVSFGGALVSIAILYHYLVHFPLRDGSPAAWWTLFLSGLTGFGSFLAYMTYGYLDSWHGAATLALLPTFILGLAFAWPTLHRPRHAESLLPSAVPLTIDTPYAIGRALMLATAFGLFAAGLTILTVGATTVFVPQDLQYMNLTARDLHRINPRLIPLIAHDRAGFGGAVCTGGLLLFLINWSGRPTPALWQANLLSLLVGFSTAIVIHPMIGYTNFIHLAPAYLGALTTTFALLLTYPRSHRVPQLSPQPAIGPAMME